MAFSDPQQIVAELPLRPDMRVADFGAGSGHYALAAARKVGGDGRVYAVDLQKELLARLKEDSIREGMTNIDVLWGDIDETGGSRLASESVDAVIIANVLFQVEHRNKVAQEAMRVLKKKGVALVVDWLDSFGGLGPQSEDVISTDTSKEIFEKNGFIFKKEVENAGDHHYGLIFTKE